MAIEEPLCGLLSRPERVYTSFITIVKGNSPAICAVYMFRVGQNCIYTLYTTVCMVIPCQIYRIYTV